MKLKVIITGAQGLVGQGVLLKCLESQVISEVLSVGRWPAGIKHPKLKELIVGDLLELDEYEDVLTGYHACFYCARIIPLGLDNELYAKFEIEPALSFTSRLLVLNPNMVLSFLSKYNGKDNKSGYGKINHMVEAALAKIIFRKVFFFRTRTVVPIPKQNNVFFLFRLLAYSYPILKLVAPNKVNTSGEIGAAMINSLITECEKRKLGAREIRSLAAKNVALDSQKDPFIHLVQE